MSRQRRVREDWKVLIAKQQESGLTQGVWCSENGISINTFRKMKHRLRSSSENAVGPNKADPASATEGWIKLEPQNFNQSKTTEAVELRIGRLKVTVAVI